MNTGMQQSERKTFNTVVFLTTSRYNSYTFRWKKAYSALRRKLIFHKPSLGRASTICAKALLPNTYSNDNKRMIIKVRRNVATEEYSNHTKHLEKYLLLLQDLLSSTSI